ncbi:MAG: ferritin-like domain-containing protein [Alphaproteobacteria bacterium]|nr:ferritin-like domain-containing protein [Alphaproteobacteria bacterium]
MEQVEPFFPATLTLGAVRILATADPLAKVSLSRRLAEIWRGGGLPIGYSLPPARPARPERPSLRPAKEMPKRRAFGSPAGRVALLHALAHIELNAIDLAWDIIARFSHEPLPDLFYDDWVGVAAEEAVHFELLAKRLAEFGASYGDLPAHDGLWESAAATANDLLARLAVVPLVLEARGLDVTPGMEATLKRVGDPQSAAVLRRIYLDEIAHVAAGARWFNEICRARRLIPEETFRGLVRRHFKGTLKPPLNHEARAAAGFPACYYEPLLRGDAPPLHG